MLRWRLWVVQQRAGQPGRPTADAARLQEVLVCVGLRHLNARLLETRLGPVFHRRGEFFEVILIDGVAWITFRDSALR